MLSKILGRDEPEQPPEPAVRWFTAATVYRHPTEPRSVVRTTKTLRARSVREATLLYLAETETGPPTMPNVDLTTWTQVRLDVSETGEDALDEHDRRRRQAR
ncbi:hypothetical protein ACFUIW_33640 [Streptomyces sp. NPDC057245]|uniref:hypothetical protein n=1 Tax=unclassified Streptomyces TaxID=2593676 RepID=UPI003430CE1B